MSKSTILAYFTIVLKQVDPDQIDVSGCVFSFLLQWNFSVMELTIANISV